MSLFQVKGWNVGSKVAVDQGKAKKNQKNNNTKKERNKKPKDGLKKDNKVQKRGRKEVEEEEEASEEEEPELSDSEEEQLEEKKKNEAFKKQKEAEKQTLKPSTIASLTPLQQKMMNKLSGSRFRWINEQLYTSRSEDALKLIKEQPELFDAYHEGFRSQVQGWPENPVDVFVKEFKFRSKKPVNAPGGLPGIVVDEDKGTKKVVIADMGCGEAQLAKDIDDYVKSFNKKNGGGNKKSKNNDRSARFNKLKSLNVDIHSFDLKEANERVTVADVKNVPLPDGSCSVVIFCLALMGTNFLDFVNEAYRILAPRGELWIAEIKSRFSDTKKGTQQQQGEEFVDALKLLGFFHKRTDAENKMFIRFEFFKPPQDIIEERKQKLERRKKFIEVETEKEELLKKREDVPEGEWLLKPCIYKRR